MSVGCDLRYQKAENVMFSAQSAIGENDCFGTCVILITSLYFIYFFCSFTKCWFMKLLLLNGKKFVFKVSRKCCVNTVYIIRKLLLKTPEKCERRKKSEKS